MDPDIINEYTFVTLILRIGTKNYTQGIFANL